MFDRWISIATAALCAALLHSAALAEPTGFTLDIVSGDRRVSLSREALEAIGARELRTHTPWTEEEITFTVVPGAALMDHLGLKGDTVIVAALDRYVLDLDFEVFTAEGTFVATQMNGAPIPVSKFGPYWIVYDFDRLSVPEMTEARPRSVWQLIELEVL